MSFRVRVNRTGRRTYSREYKLEVIQECSAPGASVASVAMSHRINANLVRRWIVQYRKGRLFALPPMLPVTVNALDTLLPAESKPASACGVIEIEFADVRVIVRGAVDAPALRVVLDALKR